MIPAFCNNPHWNNQLTELTKKIFLFPNPENHNILYGELIEMFDNHSKPEFLGFDFTYNAIPGYRYLENDFPHPEFVGIDVPSYFNHSNNEEDKKIIMIIGIDPKRSGECFRNIISVGTPFGFNSGKTKPYWDLIQGLIENDFTVYLTDTFKVYFTNGNNQSYRIKKFTNPEIDIHQDIFAKEIEIVKPDLIVTLGTIPRVWFSTLKKGRFSFKELKEMSFNKTDSNHSELQYTSGDKKIPILPLMHLSRRAVTKTKISENYGVENEEKLVKEYVNLIKLRISTSSI